MMSKFSVFLCGKISLFTAERAESVFSPTEPSLFSVRPIRDILWPPKRHQSKGRPDAELKNREEHLHFNPYGSSADPDCAGMQIASRRENEYVRGHKRAGWGDQGQSEAGRRQRQSQPHGNSR